MADTFWGKYARCAKVYGLFFWIVLFVADWLVRQTAITWWKSVDMGQPSTNAHHYPTFYPSHHSIFGVLEREEAWGMVTDSLQWNCWRESARECDYVKTSDWSWNGSCGYTLARVREGKCWEGCGGGGRGRRI